MPFLSWARFATVLCGTEALRFFLEHDVAGGHAETRRAETRRGVEAPTGQELGKS